MRLALERLFKYLGATREEAITHDNEDLVRAERSWERHLEIGFHQDRTGRNQDMSRDGTHKARILRKHIWSHATGEQVKGIGLDGF